MVSRGSLDGLSGATVLVTGASGLVGTYLLACLGAVNDVSGPLKIHAQSVSDLPSHLGPILARARAQHLRADLASFQDYERLPTADVIIHAAGYAQPLRFMTNPAATLQVASAATLALLQRVRPGGHFSFLSSAQVYTGLGDVLCHESMVGTTTPDHPRASYIEGKRAGEAACHAFRARNLHATAARLGDVYGPGTRPHDKRALNSFIEQALTTGEVRLLDSGAALRSYGYVADAVEMLFNVLLRGRETVYNVGGQSLTTIRDLASSIGGLTKSPVHAGPPSAGVAGAPDVLRLDLTRYASEFGLPRHRELSSGLEATIDWQRGLYNS